MDKLGQNQQYPYSLRVVQDIQKVQSGHKRWDLRKKYKHASCFFSCYLTIHFYTFRIEELSKQYSGLEDEFRQALQIEASRFEQVTQNTWTNSLDALEVHIVLNKMLTCYII